MKNECLKSGALMTLPAVLDEANPRLYVVYQPVVRMHGSEARVWAYEALLRVEPNTENHSTLSVIADAEQNGTIAHLDTMIVRQVCLDAVKWSDMNLWINLSQRTLSNPAAAREIADLISEHNLNCRITVEMTETADGSEALIIESLRYLMGSNIRVVIDDIDDGHSKSHLLQSDLIAGCKISRRSTVRISTDPQRLRTITNLVSWCRKNGKSVVMEGIENKSELEVARTLGVDFCQGYYFCAPILLSQAPAPGSKYRFDPMSHTSSW